jgi:Flp pilus assembly protein CpaB
VPVADDAVALLDGVRGRAWPRRALIGALTALAVASALSVLAPKPPRTLALWTAARDLAGGAPLAATDVVTRAFPVGDVPAGALRSGATVVGRLLAAPVRRGEALTDVRLLGPSLLAALDRPGLVAVPVRVTDGSAAAALVRVGDVVDVLAVPDATTGGPSTPSTVASGVRVLAVPVRDATGSDPGGLVVVAVTPSQATALAQAASTTRLSLALRRP